MNDSSTSGRTLRVLSIDGGGMRGVYTAAYLNSLAKAFASKRSVSKLDIGKAFDLIVGTSTGGIIACGLAYGTRLDSIVDLYRQWGSKIFPLPLVENISKLFWDDFFHRRAALQAGTAALRKALDDEFGDETLGSVYERRGIALAIPAVNMSHHRSWVFKTDHIEGNFGRDSAYTLSDVCMATSAAPIFRSIATINTPNDSKNVQFFVDGGLWANNPILVALIDVLSMSAEKDEIEIFSIDTCGAPAGELITESDVHRTLTAWRAGADIAPIAIAAQEFAYDNMARLIMPYLNRTCRIVRFPMQALPKDFLQYLHLDDTREESLHALEQQARTDAESVLSKYKNGEDEVARRIGSLYTSAPEFKT